MGRRITCKGVIPRYLIERMIAAYIRESVEGDGLNLQRESIKSWLLAQGLDVEGVTWYEDTLIDSKSTRSGLEALSRAVLASQVTTVVIWRLDRIARSVRDEISMLTDWCQRGLRIVSVAQGIDILGQETSNARLLAALQAIDNVAREERRIERIAEAKKKAAAQQRRRAFFSKQKQAVWDLHHAGLGIQEIAEKLGIPADKVSNYLIIV